jgi:hypothetical protein
MEPAKPIFIIKIPYSINQSFFVDMRKDLEKQFGSEYHVLLVVHNGFDFDFDVFYPKEVPEKTIDEVLNIIREKSDEILKKQEKLSL